jgi:hypothetical protein
MGLLPQAWRTFVGLFVCLGTPMAVAAWWRDLAARHPLASASMAGGWVLLLGVTALMRKALAEPADRRLKQAGDSLDKVLARRVSRYRRQYRRWVLDSRRYLDVKGLATTGDQTPELDEVYVDLALARRAPHLVPGDPLSDVPEDVTERYPIRTFIDRREPVALAVIGAPGSGKTTLLVSVARNCARTGRRQGRDIPVLLALRDHSAAVVSNPEIALAEIIRAATRTAQAHEPAGWWEWQLRRGRCVLLLDGLDEVAADTARTALAQWVERQISYYPDNHFVLTSRPRGYRNAIIDRANVLQVRPFTPDQVRQFLEGWYLAIERRAAQATTKDELRAVQIRAQDAAEDLIGRLRAAPALHDLTVNPLLLTMVANVHRYRGALPGSRADLYSEICQVMLSRRQQAKNLPENMSWPAKERLLTQLAFVMMDRRVRDLRRDQVLEILKPSLDRLPNAIEGQDFLDDVSFNGLLVERENGQYAFAHFTFQEYLAARHIKENALASRLVEAVGDTWWRETTLLYSSAADADAIVEAGLKDGGIAALALAMECADTGNELASKLRHRLDQIQAAAFSEDCDPGHRRLIGAVLATRLARQYISAKNGSRVCTHVVPASIYWLFLRDIPTPLPDGLYQPGSDLARPVTGVRGEEALAFTSWLNTITTGMEQAQFRLPTQSELDTPAVTEALVLQHTGPIGETTVSCLWTRQETGGEVIRAWVPPGRPHPHHVSGATLRHAIASDAIDTPLLLQLAIVSAYTSARTHVLALNLVDASNRGLERTQALDLARALCRTQGRDLTRALSLAVLLDRNLDCDPP